ncbi:MAG: right-handed parallel beta-helix repeat-containing protein, partial [Verrucomicrobiales bacterium]
PFATLERARDEIRKRKRSGGLPKGGIRVWLHAGDYALAKTFELGKQDSGTAEAEIVYQAAKGARVILTGGKRVNGFAKVTDAGVLERLMPEARGKVMRADLRASGIEDFGKVDKGGIAVFFNGKAMTLARWPNEGFVKIVDTSGDQPVVVRSTKGDKSGKFLYEGERPSRWLAEPDPWLHGYWYWDWSDSRQAIGAIDVAKHQFTLKPPQHIYGYRKGQWYYALNLLSELDAPGEWYVDREAGLLYFWPPSDVAAGRVEVSVLGTLLSLIDVEHVSFRGMRFHLTRGTAIKIAKGKNVQIVGCEIRNAGENGVTVAAGEGHRVVGCDLSSLGNGGISMRGGDRKTLKPAGHEASNNHIHDYGRWKRMYSAGVSVSGVGNRVAHNLIHDAPHQAISFSGNDHRIEFNDIHDVCLESNDAGAIYAGRDWTMRGTVIRHNFLHDVTGFEDRGSVGVYLDDMFGGTEISGNIFLRVTRAAYIGGGRDVIVDNNIFIDCDRALHIDARAMGWASGSVPTTMKTRLDAMPIHSELWKKRYPKLPGLWADEPAAPKGNLITRNLFQGEKKWDDINSVSRPYVKLENNLVAKDVGLVDAAANDFRLRKDSPARKIGFKEIPVEKIGLMEDENRALLKKK